MTVEKLKTPSIFLNVNLALFTFSAMIMFSWSPVAIPVIHWSLHAQKPRQDVDKYPEKREESALTAANQRARLEYCDQ